MTLNCSRIKDVFVPALVIRLALVVGACLGPVTPAAARPGRAPQLPARVVTGISAALAHYDDPDGFLSLDYPQKWSARKSGSEMQFWADKQGQVAVAVSIHIKALSAQSLMDDITRLFAERRDNYDEMSRDTTEVDGYAGEWVEYVYEENGVAYQGFCLTVVRNRVGIVLLGWAPKTTYLKYAATLTAIAHSLRVAEFDEAPPYEEWLTYKSRHFVFHYLPATYVAGRIKSIAQEHEQVYADIVRTLKLDYTRVISFYLYSSEESLYRSTARTSGHAITEAGEVHALWQSAQEHQSLGHEMTHVITAQSIGEPSEALLGEGIAVCLDHSGNDYKAAAARLLAARKLIPLKQMLGEAWFQKDSAIAYPQSGSFVCFLLKSADVARFKRAYSQANFSTALSQVYNTTLTALEKKWLDWLRAP
jgi:hypothetical protein